VLNYAPSRLGCDYMHDDEEPIRIPIAEVFDLHAVEPREVAAVVEAYLKEAARSASILCGSSTVAASVSSAESCVQC
jgi:hypothetical protein